MNSLVVSIGRVAWGYVFLYLDFNLNINAMSLNLLPDWACYVFVLAALPGLALAEKSSALLRPLAWILLVAEAIHWLLALLGISPDSGMLYTIASAVITVVSLYFHFQLLTNVADIAARYSERRARSIRILRNVTVVLGTITFLPWPVYLLDVGMQTAVALLLIIVALIQVIWTLAALFGLRGEIRRAGEERVGE